MENGKEHWSDRLDRIEGIIEATASRQGEIENEFPRLLKAQVVLQDDLSKFVNASTSRMDRTEQILSEAGDKLNALITFVDQRFHEHRANP